ncbi:L,D-transpeptidase family protein [Blastomonas sp.]|uniref:L,D-transpeptidase family protein n=1 Tax=Blastomonas sp. TaxID=1909299 RepID=UPI00260BACEE|nr:L,D-transpeptidase family protein [Blastomonas sp.]MDM7956855.1 L,D-transpeptidase family protein [Blastomonas sp.]
MSDTIRVDVEALTVTLGDWRVPCVIGRGGACAADAKHEGDGCTPLGRWPIRAALLRPGRAAPPAGFALPWRWTSPGDGWSDDPADPAYNRPVRLPHGFSAETLQRDDMLYDVILVLGHNDEPPVAGNGSAIFFHLWNEAKPVPERSTEGCVAIARADMEALLVKLVPGMVLEIG